MVRRSLFALYVASCLVAAACGRAEAPAAAGRWNSSSELVISAIPDQEPQQLERLYSRVADYLSGELEIPVRYVPVSDYAVSVSLFRVGDLDLVWYGGLTGVQARLQVPGARAIAQRDIDAHFRSVFIANTSAGLPQIYETEELDVVAGTRFTFGSESSTSGRLMPQYFLQRAGVSLDDFDGEPGFSGDHDKTIDLVESGTYEAGVVNEQVWEARLEAGTVDTGRVAELFRTPPYHDYHWVIHPDVDERYGDGFSEAALKALLSLDRTRRQDRAVLDLFGARRFIPTHGDNYDHIEQVGRSVGLIE